MDWEQFIQKYRLKLKLTPVGENPYIQDQNWDANHYSAEIRCGTRRATFYFSQGIGIKEQPRLASILESLQLDCAAGDISLHDFMQEYEMRKDHAEASRTHRLCRRTGSKMRRLLKDKNIYVDFRAAED